MVEQGQVEMLVRNARKMREAVGALAVAAVRVDPRIRWTAPAQLGGRRVAEGYCVGRWP